MKDLTIDEVIEKYGDVINNSIDMHVKLLEYIVAAVEDSQIVEFLLLEMVAETLFTAIPANVEEDEFNDFLLEDFEFLASAVKDRYKDYKKGIRTGTIICEDKK